MTTAKVYAIKNICQKDNVTFTIEWNDGQKRDYRLSELQSRCPCAQCEEGGPRTPSDPDLRAKRILNAGRYALRIEFAKGCSSGIYSFDMLRE